jgi:secreted trypsin-like serine protease
MSTLQVTIGVHNVSAPAAKEYRVEEIVMHERYDPSTVNNDIALLRLATRTSNTPIKLPAGELVHQGAQEGQQVAVCRLSARREMSLDAAA